MASDDVLAVEQVEDIQLQVGYRKELLRYLEQRAAPHVAGRASTIVVTHIDLAGEFEPWRGSALYRVWIVRDFYPPRIDLRFKLRGPDGEVIREGGRSLRDPLFLKRSGYRDDPLRHEKMLLDYDWLRAEFPHPGA